MAQLHAPDRSHRLEPWRALSEPWDPSRTQEWLGGEIECYRRYWDCVRCLTGWHTSACRPLLGFNQTWGLVRAAVLECGFRSALAGCLGYTLLDLFLSQPDEFNFELGMYPLPEPISWCIRRFDLLVGSIDSEPQASYRIIRRAPQLSCHSQFVTAARAQPQPANCPPMQYEVGLLTMAPIFHVSA